MRPDCASRSTPGSTDLSRIRSLALLNQKFRRIQMDIFGYLYFRQLGRNRQTTWRLDGDPDGLLSTAFGKTNKIPKKVKEIVPEYQFSGNDQAEMTEVV